MKIVVLAAGEGKRMWPIQTDKCLIPFLGKPLLYHNLKQIKENVTAEFVIIATPQNKESIEKVAKELRIAYKIAIQREPKGMADAILSAKDLIGGPVLVLNAEDILDKHVYGDVLEDAEKTDADALFAGISFGKYFPGGYLKLDADKVLGIMEKPGEANVPSNIIKLVVDFFKDGKRLIDYLKKADGKRDDQYETALSKMIEDGLNVRFANYKGTWIPLKYPWHILDIMEHLLSMLERHISKEAKVSEKAVIEGNVVIENGARVFEGAVIKGPCYIGKNCIVGNNSFVRESILEEGCVTGFNSDITRSYIGANSWFHTNYVGDSIIEGDFGMGSGAVLANLRLDDQTIRVGEEKVDSGRHKLGLTAGKGSRIGVNASTMPGVRVGAGSLVGPGVVFKKDLQENKKVTLKEESYEIRDYETTPTSYDQFRDKLK